MLIDSPAPELQLSVGLVVSVVLGFTAIAAFLVRLALSARKLATVTGAEGLLGETGQALTRIAPDSMGQARVHGEIWNATAGEPIDRGARVVVLNVSGLTLTVRKA
jgi:membrane-bound serine protease (ClpP class)